MGAEARKRASLGGLGSEEERKRRRRRETTAGSEWWETPKAF